MGLSQLQAQHAPHAAQGGAPSQPLDALAEARARCAGVCSQRFGLPAL